MPRIELTKKILLKERADLVSYCHKKGYTDKEISIIFSIDRTWVYRIRNYTRRNRVKAR